MYHYWIVRLYPELSGNAQREKELYQSLTVVMCSLRYAYGLLLDFAGALGSLRSPAHSQQTQIIYPQVFPCTIGNVLLLQRRYDKSSRQSTRPCQGHVNG